MKRSEERWHTLGVLRDLKLFNTIVINTGHYAFIITHRTVQTQKVNPNINHGLLVNTNVSIQLH